MIGVDASTLLEFLLQAPLRTRVEDRPFRDLVLRETESGWVVIHHRASTFVTGDAK